MNPVASKQVALKNSLVPLEKRIKIEKYNARIEFSKPQRDEKYQVTLDALKLSTCYPVFLITAEVSDVYMHQFWNTIQKIKDTYAYRLLNQDFVEPTSKEDLVPFIQELGKTTLKKANKFKKVASPLRKLSPVLEEPAKKPKQAKKPTKKPTIMPTSSVVIRDTPSESMPKMKTPAKVVRGKGMDLLSDVALLKDAQLKKTLKKSKLETHKLHAHGLGDEGDSGDDESNDEDSDEVTRDDDDVDSDADGDKEASDNYDELYKDVNIRFQATKHEEEGKGDAEMKDVGRDDSTQKTTYEQVKDDEHAIVTTVHDTQKTEVPLHSSSVSSDFANQFQNLDNVLPTDTEVVSMMNVKVLHEEPSIQTPPFLNITVTSTPTPTIETTIAAIPYLPDFSSLFGFDQRVFALEKELSQFKQADYSVQLLEMIKSQIIIMVDAQLNTRLEDSIKKSFRSYTTEFEKKAKDKRKRYIDLVEKSVKDIIKDELKSQLLQILPKERDREDKEKDEDPPAGSDQGLKKQKTSKDAEPSRGSKSKESKSSSSKGTKSQPKSSGKSAQAEEAVFEAVDTEMPLNQGDDLGNTYDQPNVEAALRDDWVLHDIASSLEMDYLPERIWSKLDRKRSRIMIKLITGLLTYTIMIVVFNDHRASSKNRPPMLNKENYVPWSSRLLRYDKSRPNGNLIYNSIMNGPYVIRMIPELGDADREVPVNPTFHEQSDDKLTEKELKKIKVDDQAIQTILLGLPEDIYAAVDSCETAREIWLRVQQMMKEWSRHVTIVHQTKDLHTADYTQLYDFLKYNQKEVDELRAERLTKTQDPLALMANSNNPFNYPMFHPDLPSSSTFIQQPLPNNNYNPHHHFNQNYMQQPMLNPKDITDPTATMNMALVLMAKAFKLNYSTPTNNNQRISSNPQNRQIAQPVQNLSVQNVGNQNGVIVVPGIANQNGNGNIIAGRAEGNANGNNGNKIRCYNCRVLGHLARNCPVRPKRKDDAYLQTQLLIAQKEEARIQLQAKEFDLMAAVTDLDEIKEVNANYILMANLQQASTSRTQCNKAPVYDSDGSAKCGTRENSRTTSANVEKTYVLYDSLYNNLAIAVEKVNSVNRKLREINVELTTELDRYKNQEKCFEISQEKYDKLKRCYQKSIYQEQCLTKKINALHLSSGKQIMTLNKEIANLNNELSKEKSTVSSLQKEKKKLKSDSKIRKDELLDKQIQLENNIKKLDNILVKTGQSTQTMHMLSPKPNSVYHTEQKIDLGYQNSFYLKQAQQKQQSLYNGKVLLKKHDPPIVYDSKKILELAQETKFFRDFKSLEKETDESISKHKALELEIECLLRAVVSQDIMSIVQKNSVVDTSNLQTELEHTKERFKNCIIKKEMNMLNLGMIGKKYEECKYEKNSYDKAYNDMQQKFERLQAQLGDLKGKSKDTSCVSDTLNPLPQKLKNENVEIEFQVVDNEKVIAPGMFRIDPFKNTMEEKYMPSKLNKASVRTNSITALQPHVITKKVVNSDSYGFSSTGVDITTKTRRPQPRINIKNDRVPSTSKSSRIKNKGVKVEDHLRNLLLSKNTKHMSSKCNNVKLAIRNDKSEIVYAMCKKCLITENHDVCVLNYVNGMDSRSNNQKENVSNIANKMKHKA
nr:hypothetical protein [Tanacetum cinerariifolium]